MSNWNDNRTKQNRPGTKRDWSKFRKPRTRTPGEVVDNSPPEEPMPVSVDWPDVLAVDLFKDRTRASEETRWSLALIIAIVGLLLVLTVVGDPIHQIIWTLATLVLVVAVKR